MTEKEAYNILGLPFGTELHELKKKYKKLMLQVHSDASVHAKETYAYSAQEINIAYSTLREKSFTETEKKAHCKKGSRQSRSIKTGRSALPIQT